MIFIIGILLNYIIIYNRKQLIQQQSKSIIYSEDYCPKTKYNIISNQNEKDIDKIKFESFDNNIYETTNIYKGLDDPNFVPDLQYNTDYINNVNIFKNNNIAKWDIKMSSNN